MLTSSNGLKPFSLKNHSREMINIPPAKVGLLEKSNISYSSDRKKSDSGRKEEAWCDRSLNKFF